MAEISTYMSTFFNEIVNYGYTIPIQFKIYALVILLIIVAELYLVFLKNVPLSAKYIKWGFAFIVINIVNMIITFKMYMKYNGKFIGESGKKGKPGEKGLVGENITCKLCDFNIYLQKTERYDFKLNFSTNIFKLLYNQDFNYISIYNTFNSTELDTDRILTSLYTNNLSSSMSQLPNLINNQKYVLMYDLLKAVLPTYEKLTIKTPGKKRGYTPVTDVIIPDTYKGTSYVFNSDDMRYPTSYSKLASIYSIEDNKKTKYDIMLPNGPTEAATTYKTLGVVLFKSGQKIELNQYVCLNQKCLKPADIQDYHIKLIYPDSRTGFISFWMSDFNTMQINYAQESDIKEGKRIIEIIKDYQPNIYYSSGAVKKETINQTTTFYNNIKISKLSIFCFIVSTYISIINTDYTIFKNKYVSQLNIKMGIHIEDEITYSNVTTILNKITSELARVENEYNKTVATLSTIPVESIINGTIDKGTLIFNANKHVNMMRKTLDFIPAYIENTNTLMELVNKIFVDGLYTRVKLVELTQHQKSLIYLLKVLLPPTKEIYIPKNSCLVYEQIDENRIALEKSAEKVIADYNTLIADINTDTTNKYSLEIRNEINRLNEIIKYEFDNNLSNIINYIEKMSLYNFKEFTKNQLTIIIEQYTKVLNVVADPN
jgi:hypothetical protein